MSTYAYANSQPQSAVDPFGLQTQQVNVRNVNIPTSYTYVHSNAVVRIQQIQQYNPSFRYGVMNAPGRSLSYSQRDVVFLTQTLNMYQQQANIQYPTSCPIARWNNGWRNAAGRFVSPNGAAGRSGASAERAVWEAVRAKSGNWTVIEGIVGARNASGQQRFYDGVAISPAGRAIGLEVKSGTATRNPAQRSFDAAVSSSTPAIGTGPNSGLVIQRAVLIKKK